MNKSELAEEICEELGLDYYEVYNEDGANVTAKFLQSVHDAVVYETRDPHEAVDYDQYYDGPLDLIEEMEGQVKGTDLNSVGWSIFQGEFLQDLEALKKMIRGERGE